MGWDSATLTVYVSLDRHGGEVQTEHDKLWDDLCEEIRKLVEQEKFKPIKASI